MLDHSFSDNFIKETLKQSPVRRLRSPYSLDEAAQRIGMYRNSLYLYEVGVYSEPPYDIWSEFRPNGTEFQEFKTQYSAYRHYKRQLFIDKTPVGFFREAFLEAKSSNSKSPIQSMIDYIGCSNIALCKILCINPGVLHSLVKGKKAKLSMEVENCFIELGLDFVDIDELNERQKEFCG